LVEAFVGRAAREGIRPKYGAPTLTETLQNPRDGDVAEVARATATASNRAFGVAAAASPRGATSRRGARGVERRRRRRDARAKPRPSETRERFPSRARSTPPPETRADAIVARAAAATARENDGDASKREVKTHHSSNAGPWGAALRA